MLLDDFLLGGISPHLHWYFSHTSIELLEFQGLLRQEWRNLHIYWAASFLSETCSKELSIHFIFFACLWRLSSSFTQGTIITWPLLPILYSKSMDAVVFWPRALNRSKNNRFKQCFNALVSLPKSFDKHGMSLELKWHSPQAKFLLLWLPHWMRRLPGYLPAVMELSFPDWQAYELKELWLLPMTTAFFGICTDIEWSLIFLLLSWVCCH